MRYWVETYECERIGIPVHENQLELDHLVF